MLRHRPRIAAASDAVDTVLLDIVLPALDRLVERVERRAMPPLARYLRRRAEYAADVETVSVDFRRLDHVLTHAEADTVSGALALYAAQLRFAADALEVLPVPSTDRPERADYARIVAIKALP